MKYTKDNHAHIFNTHHHGELPDTEVCRRCGLPRSTVETGSTADTRSVFLSQHPPKAQPKDYMMGLRDGIEGTKKEVMKTIEKLLFPEDET